MNRSEATSRKVISMSMFSTSNYAYFYDDGRRMYHSAIGEVELADEFDWDSEARDVLEANGISVAGMLEPYAGIFVTDDGDVVDAQYRMAAISMAV